MSQPEPHRAAVVTVSDGVFAGVREDSSGRAVAELLEERGFDVVRRDVVPDERGDIESILGRLAGAGVDLVATTGGTGLGPRDVTPEATRAVIDREAPGLAEEMRAAGRASTPMAALSRAVAGSRGSTLIVNLPGSERGAIESLSAILGVLPHALELLAGRTAHGPGDAASDDVSAGSGAALQGGGAVTSPRSPTLEDELARRQGAGEEVVLGTAVRVEGEPPCRVGQKILLGRHGPLAGTLGCAEFDDAAAEEAPGVLDAATPATRVYVHDLGSIEVFLEPFLERPRLVLLSATPIALHVMRWAGDLGFGPVLVEPRADRVGPEHRSAGPVVASLEDVELDERTSAVLTDHDAPGVADSIASLLRSPARFVGVLGSARHIGPYMDGLRDRGFAEEDLNRVRTPVGIDIGARTAEEIALSILAGLVADRHGAAGGWLDRREGPPGRGGGPDTG